MTRRTAALHPVAVVSRWTGFCLPCGSDERPLVLTWTGLRGLRGWLSGASFSDGQLRLTCACCGGVDVVGWEDEPEPLEEQALEVQAPEVREPVPVEVELPVLVPAGPVVAAAPLHDVRAEVQAELQALLGDRFAPAVTWHAPAEQAEPQPAAASAPAPQPEPVVASAPEPPAVPPAAPPAVPAAAPAPAPAVVRVVQVLDLDTPSAGALHAVAEVPPPRAPSRAERRAAERAARRAPAAAAGVSDADALDVLDLVG